VSTPATGRSLLAVFAHPDDESLACGGLLAMCAESGARVTILCLTRGEHGPGGGSHSLRDVREAELRDAARVLGVHEVVLLAHEDGMLPWIAPSVLEADVLAVIRRTAPDVVVTFDEDGLYWHPDHVAVHERTTSAVAGLGDDAPALRYVTLAAGAMRGVLEATGADSLFGVEDVDAFGAAAPSPSYTIDVTRWTATKLEALRCHRSQVDGGAFDRISLDDAERLLGVEQLRRAGVGSEAAFIDGLADSLVRARA